VDEIRPGMNDFLAQLSAMTKAEQEGRASKEDRTAFQRRLIELHERLQLYIVVTESFELPPMPDLDELKQDPERGRQYLINLRRYLDRVETELTENKAPRPVAVAIEPGQPAESAWQHLPLAWWMGLVSAKPDEVVDGYQKMKDAYAAGDARGFNDALARYESSLAHSPPPLYQPRRVNLEAYFNFVSPFYAGITFYVLAFLLAVFGWLLQYRPLNWTAFTVLLMTFLFHTAALVLRIYISGRPPVTNLYSSAIFIGWAVVLAALVLEMIFRLGLGNVAASIAGFATLLISYFLSTGGDTITVLQAVLDTQFWLATHVVCVTLGYSATYLAGIFGLLYVIFGLATPLLNERSRKDLGRMIYGITCFAILFSFYGTVLGGLWADDSWGRFWGWDPKENGALMIVLWELFILHARMGGYIRDTGLAMAAIFGGMIVAFSWWGVNLLGIGLHSYGFTSGIMRSLLVFYILEVIMLGACVVLWMRTRKTHTPGGSSTPAIAGGRP
jgi:ABC-type transport system involved in cytochrome c biogenesis permease subunit